MFIKNKDLYKEHVYKDLYKEHVYKEQRFV